MSMKNPLTPAGIEPAIFRFVAQHLNHCAIAVPICLIRCYILRSKLHVSVGSGHHQLLSFDSLKIILYNSRGGVFNEEISTSRPLLGHSTAILGVWVNHVIIHKNITLYYQNKKK